MLPKAVFLDKDGTLVENVPYNVNPAQIRLAAGVLQGLQQLHQAGYRLFIVTNQSGVAHGYYQEEALQQVEAHLRELMSAAGIPLGGFYFCPHHPDGRVQRYAVSCFCRKPNPGMFFKAAREHGLNLAQSWVVGDILNDVEAGRRVDCRTVLIDNGNETEWKLAPLRQPHFTVKNFLEAVYAVLGIPGKPAASEEQPIQVNLPMPFRVNRPSVDA